MRSFDAASTCWDGVGSGGVGGRRVRGSGTSGEPAQQKQANAFSDRGHQNSAFNTESSSCLEVPANLYVSSWFYLNGREVDQFGFKLDMVASEQVSANQGEAP